MAIVCKDAGPNNLVLDILTIHFLQSIEQLKYCKEKQGRFDIPIKVGENAPTEVCGMYNAYAACAGGHECIGEEREGLRQVTQVTGIWASPRRTDHPAPTP